MPDKACPAASKAMPPLSPVLLAGLLARPLPLAPLQPLLAAAMTTMCRRHPEVFDRLASDGAVAYLVDPVDLPFTFVLEVSGSRPRLVARRRGAGSATAATIRAPFATLIRLLEGRVDGDALFFSRDIIVEGDTEAVLVLRNAVDGADIDVATTLLEALGPAAGLLRRLARLYAVAADDLELLRGAVVAPLARRLDAQAAGLERLGERIDDLGRAARARTERAS